MEKFTHAIVAVDENSEVLHFIGFWGNPTDIDFDAIQEELEINEELGMTDVDFTLELATQDVIDFYNDLIEENETFEIRFNDGQTTLQ